MRAGDLLDNVSVNQLADATMGHGGVVGDDAQILHASSDEALNENFGYADVYETRKQYAHAVEAVRFDGFFNGCNFRLCHWYHSFQIFQVQCTLIVSHYYDTIFQRNVKGFYARSGRLPYIPETTIEAG